MTKLYRLLHILLLSLLVTLALIRLRFVELGFRQIKRKYVQYNRTLRE